MSAALSCSHGANDAQKSMGVIAALLLAGGHIDTRSVPLVLGVEAELSARAPALTGQRNESTSPAIRALILACVGASRCAGPPGGQRSRVSRIRRPSAATAGSVLRDWRARS